MPTCSCPITQAQSRLLLPVYGPGMSQMGEPMTAARPPEATGSARNSGHGLSSGVGVGLADAIGLIRSELAAAAAAGIKSGLAFRTGPIELEFEVVFDVSGGLDAGVRVWVVSIGGKSDVSRSHTQRLKVTLNPVDRRSGEDALVADEDE